MDFKSKALFNATSLGATVSSDTVDMTHAFQASIHSVWTGGTASGDLVVQISNDGTTWHDYDTTAVSGAGSDFYEKADFPAKYLRLTYTRTAGTGSITSTMFTKVFI